MAHVTLLPPAEHGSLGDEAMMLAAIGELGRQGVLSFRVVGIGKYPYLTLASAEGISVEQTDIASFYPHLINDGLATVTEIVSGCDAFYCFGADVLDGRYSEDRSILMLRMVEWAAKLLDRVVILGCSLSEEPSRKCLNRLLELPRKVLLCVRDPVSLRRLPQALRCRVRLVADPAFLLKPQGFDLCCSDLRQWMRERRSDGRLILGLNLGYHALLNPAITELDSVLDIFVNLIVRLVGGESCSFVLISHDSRDPYGDTRLLNALVRNLPASVADNCFILPVDCTAAHVKSVVAELDLVICSRLHLAIASLGQQTPVACLTYQGKFEGVFEHFGIEGLTLNPAYVLDRDRLFYFVMRALNQRDDLRRLIAAALPTVMELAKANFYD
jgi:polysaccharide pyruvyl transferase WcaK-like protein